MAPAKREPGLLGDLAHGAGGAVGSLVKGVDQVLDTAVGVATNVIDQVIPHPSPSPSPSPSPPPTAPPVVTTPPPQVGDIVGNIIGGVVGDIKHVADGAVSVLTQNLPPPSPAGPSATGAPHTSDAPNLIDVVHQVVGGAGSVADQLLGGITEALAKPTATASSSQSHAGLGDIVTGVAGAVLGQVTQIVSAAESVVTHVILPPGPGPTATASSSNGGPGLGLGGVVSGILGGVSTLVDDGISVVSHIVGGVTSALLPPPSTATSRLDPVGGLTSVIGHVVSDATSIVGDLTSIIGDPTRTGVVGGLTSALGSATQILPPLPIVTSIGGIVTSQVSGAAQSAVTTTKGSLVDSIVNGATSLFGQPSKTADVSPPAQSLSHTGSPQGSSSAAGATAQPTNVSVNSGSTQPAGESASSYGGSASQAEGTSAAASRGGASFTDTSPTGAPTTGNASPTETSREGATQTSPVISLETGSSTHSFSNTAQDSQSTASQHTQTQTQLTQTGSLTSDPVSRSVTSTGSVDTVHSLITSSVSSTFTVIVNPFYGARVTDTEGTLGGVLPTGSSLPGHHGSGGKGEGAGGGDGDGDGDGSGGGDGGVNKLPSSLIGVLIGLLALGLMFGAMFAIRMRLRRKRAARLEGWVARKGISPKGIEGGPQMRGRGISSGVEPTPRWSGESWESPGPDPFSRSRVTIIPSASRVSLPSTSTSSYLISTSPDASQSTFDMSGFLPSMLDSSLQSPLEPLPLRPTPARLSIIVPPHNFPRQEPPSPFDRGQINSRVSMALSTTSSQYPHYSLDLAAFPTPPTTTAPSSLYGASRPNTAETVPPVPFRAGPLRDPFADPEDEAPQFFSRGAGRAQDTHVLQSPTDFHAHYHNLVPPQSPLDELPSPMPSSATRSAFDHEAIEAEDPFKSKKTYVRRSWIPKAPDEIAVSAGEVVLVIARPSNMNGWALVKLLNNENGISRRGLIPVPCLDTDDVGTRTSRFSTTSTLRAAT